ncbi:hypothetical protein EPO34_01055 [Patescibacteria group bacterium]|nr:MAG: hypothetical protein EPO34_01055 [Patescibacteria group bacterium]
MKFAEVYPLKRFPRRFRAFDYSVPEGTVVGRGDFVMVPLRGWSVVGIVAALKDTPPVGIDPKPVERALGASLTGRELDAYESLAADLVQSPSSVMHAVLPVPPKRTKPSVFDSEVAQTRGAVSGQPAAVKASGPSPGLRIRTQDAPDITEAVRFITDLPASFVRSPDLRHGAALIATYRRACPGPIRIAAPNVRDARLLHAALGGEILTGEESNGSRFAAWQGFRSTKDGLLIGTRLVSMLEHPLGSTLFLVRSGHENHRQADRNPRYDARRAAVRWNASGDRIVFLDAFPRPDDLHLFPDSLRCPALDPIRAIAMTGRESWPHAFISPPVFEGVQDAMETGGRVLLAFNRKGMARVLSCQGCGWTVPLAGAAPPRFCDSCHSSDLHERGFGTRAIRKALQGAFPDATVAVCEKGEGATDARIVIATKHYLENAFDPFDPEPFAMVADLDADAGLADRSQRAVERTLCTAAQWQAVARAARAPFLIQTARPELFVRAFHDPVRILREELETRRAYGLEPFVRWITVDGVEQPLSDSSSLSALPDSVVIDTNAFL